MPSFAVGQSVRGLSVANDIVIGAPGQEVNAAVRLTGPVLFLPSASSINCKCKYEEAPARRTLILKLDSAAGQPLLDGQVVLTSLEVRIWFPQGGGALAPTLTDPLSVVGTGVAEWRNLPPALGIAGNALTLVAEYRHTGAGVGAFTLKLGAAVDLPVLMCRLVQAEIGAEPLPAEQAIVLSIAGGATLTPAAKSGAGALLDPLFGAGAVNALAAPSFSYRHKFKAGQPVGVPTIGLSMDWNAGAPALAINPPVELGVAIKAPRFLFTLPDLATPPAGFGIQFPDCSIRFPGIAGMQALEIGGAFDLVKDAVTNAIRLNFKPTIPGGIDLPLIIRLLFSRLEWIGSAIEDLVAHAEHSLAEAEWVEMFRALLPGAGAALNVAQFTAAFQTLVGSALASAGLAPERLFLLIFEAFRGRADSGQLFGIVLQEWLANAARAAPTAIASLLRTLGALAPGDFRAVLAALVGRAGVDFTALLLALMPPNLDFASPAALQVQRLIAQFMGALVDGLAPDAVAKFLVDAWHTAPAALRAPSTAGDPRLARFDLSFRAVTRHICEGISVLVLLADENLRLLRSVLPEIQLPRTERFLQHFLSPVTNLFEELDRGLFPPWSKLMPMLQAMAAYSAGDRSREILLLEASRYPLAGIAVTLGALFLALQRPTPWTSLLGRDIENLPGVKTKRFPPPFEHPTDPAKSVKYLILSDIHRDAAGDDRGTFNFGSIHHFSKNKQLYLELLEKADAAGYVVLEAGDCEELWFIRDFDAFQGFPQLVRDVIAAHRPVYEKLRDMHQRGRYFRIYGNHDSYLREADVFEPLKTFMETGHGVPFEIFDFFVMANVKGMNDGVLDMITDWPTAVNAKKTFEDWMSATVKHFAEGTVGLDSRPYRNRKQLIVTHGHQWDFWNCDEHNLVGKMLANMVGVTVDKLMDPFTDVEGIGYMGNPVFDFRDIAAALYPADNWLSSDTAERFAHVIQHMNDNERVLNDGVGYCESLVALTAAFGLPLDKYVLRTNAAGDPILDAQGRPQYDRTALNAQPNPFKRAMEHHGHLICVGHTHAPHSMPYFPLARYLFGPILGDILHFILANIPFLSGIKFKSGYLNSGTCGWFEGVLWGIEVHETGQPRLVYWSQDADRPHTMDWELTPWDKAKRQRFDQILKAIVPSVADYFEKIGARFGGAAMEIARASMPVLSIPPEIAALLATGAQPPSPVNLDEARDDSPVERLQSTLLQVFAMLQRLANDPSSLAGPHVFTVSVAVPPAIESRLTDFRTQIGGALGVADPLRTAAGVVFALGNLERLSRGIRQFPHLSLDEQSQFDRVWMVMLILVVIPDTPKFRTTVALANGTLTLTISLTK